MQLEEGAGAPQCCSHGPDMPFLAVCTSRHGTWLRPGGTWQGCVYTTPYHASLCITVHSVCMVSAQCVSVLSALLRCPTCRAHNTNCMHGAARPSAQIGKARVASPCCGLRVVLVWCAMHPVQDTGCNRWYCAAGASGAPHCTARAGAGPCTAGAVGAPGMTHTAARQWCTLGTAHVYAWVAFVAKFMSCSWHPPLPGCYACAALLTATGLPLMCSPVLPQRQLGERGMGQVRVSRSRHVVADKHHGCAHHKWSLPGTMW